MKVFCSTFLLLSPLIILPVVINNKKPIWSGDWLDNLFPSSGINLAKVDVSSSPSTNCDKYINCLSEDTLNKLLEKLQKTTSS